MEAVEVLQDISPGCTIRFEDVKDKISDEEFYKLVKEGYFVQPAFSSVWIRTGTVEPQWVSAGREAKLALLVEIKPGRKVYESDKITIVRPAYKCIAVVSDYHSLGEEFEFHEPEELFVTWYDGLRVLDSQEAYETVIDWLNEIIKKYKQRLIILSTYEELSIRDTELRAFTREAKKVIDEFKSKIRYYVTTKDVKKLITTIQDFEDYVKNRLYLPALGFKDDVDEMLTWTEIIRKELEEKVVSVNELLKKYPIHEYITEILDYLEPKQPYPNYYTFLDVPSIEEVISALKRAKEPRKKYISKMKVIDTLKAKYKIEAISFVINKLIEDGILAEHSRDPTLIKFTENLKKQKIATLEHFF